VLVGQTSRIAKFDTSAAQSSYLWSSRECRGKIFAFLVIVFIAPTIVDRCLADADRAAAAIERERGKPCSAELRLTLAAIAADRMRRRA
jgi:hypothetical protein